LNKSGLLLHGWQAGSFIRRSGNDTPPKAKVKWKFGHLRARFSRVFEGLCPVKHYKNILKTHANRAFTGSKGISGLHRPTQWPGSPDISGLLNLPNRHNRREIEGFRVLSRTLIRLHCVQKATLERSGRAMSEILLVEDDPLVTRALASLLSEAGYQPVVFHMGMQALEHARSNPASLAAVVDIHLPDLNGLIVSHKLREQYGPNVPIIVLSGDTSMENLNALPFVGATYFLSKPINGAFLLDRLKQLLQADPHPAQ
jgi:CheY-like chemotaxis protein